MDESLHLPDDLDQPLPPEPQALLDQFKVYAVWHPRLLQVQTQLLHTIWEPAEVAFVVVCGPSGVGKSKLAEALARRLNTPKQRSNEPIPRRALLINTRPSDGALFHRTGYYQKGLQLLGKTTFDRRIKVDITTAEQTVEKKRPRGKITPYQDHPEVRDAYEEELRLQALHSVILDEAPHLIQTSDGKQPKDQLNWIKSMTTETGVLHILIGTYGLLPFCNLDGQNESRESLLGLSGLPEVGAKAHDYAPAPSPSTQTIDRSDAALQNGREGSRSVHWDEVGRCKRESNPRSALFQDRLNWMRCAWCNR